MPIEIDLFLDHTRGRSVVEVLLRGHLWVEKHLISLLEADLEKPEALDLDRMTFSQKTKLADAFGLLHPDEVGTIRILNAMRNRLAHDLSGAPSDGDVARLEQAQTASQRALAEKLLTIMIEDGPNDPEHESARRLSAAVLALLTELEQHGQRHAYWRQHRTALEGYAVIVAMSKQIGMTPKTEVEYRQALGIPDPPTASDAIIRRSTGSDEHGT